MKKIVLDLETKRSFDEVGGRHNKAKLGISLVGTYHYRSDEYIAYRENELDRLEPKLREADLLIGFNLIGFDWPVLAAALGDWVYKLPTLDLMFEAQKTLGHRVSLNSMATATLGIGKLGSGLDALEYYKNGDWESLEEYCLEDVRITKEIYDFAEKNGYAYYTQYKGRKGKARVAMSFAKNSYSKIFQRAAKNKNALIIVYGGKERRIDVHRFDGIYIRAYCHLRRKDLSFRLDKVESVKEISAEIPLFKPEQL